MLLPPLIIIVWFGAIMLFRKGEGTIDAKSYESRAVEYIREKYGDTVKPVSNRAAYSDDQRTGRKVEHITISFGDFEVYVDDKVICDNRQYEEIRSAVEERYINDSKLGSSWEGKWSLVFCEAPGRSKFTSTYFDGDLDKFIDEAQVTLYANITYDGFPEKDEQYRQLLTDKAAEIKSCFDILDYNGENNLDVTLYVRDPSADLPEMTNKAGNSSRIYRFPRYEEYMEYIAYAYVGHHHVSGGYAPYDCEMKIFHPEFFDIDEYTAISDNCTPIVSADEIIFYPVDFSQDTTFHSPHSDDLSVTVRDVGWKADIERERLYDIFLRLDRAHYGITEHTEPLTVGYDKNGRQICMSVGYSNVGALDNDDDWYYLDDKYLYLYIQANKYTFAEEEWFIALSDRTDAGEG